MPEPARPHTAPGAAERLLQRLEWTVLRRLDGLLQGDSRTLLRGAGIDLADLREYQPHDDVRHIDWNVTARLATPHVRVYTEDRDMTAWFLLDLSPSVDFGAPGQAKRDMLAGFVGVLARLIQRHGNRVGAVLHDGRAALGRVLPAGGGRRQVLQLLHLLAGGQGAPGLAAPPGITDLRQLLTQAQGLLRRCSAVFVVSDFLSTPGWDKPLARLARRHDVVAVRLLDPLELELPDMGLLLLRDPETGEQLQVDTHERGFRHRFARLAAQREAELRAGLARAGVDTLELSTDEDLLGALVRFMQLRGRRPRLAAGSPALAAAS
ncbi:MAG: DUF58 domain-containing protein [Proteobacteria bacterium]|nr:DUF58 domain-containing protein [Pseudomonadota bacterium]